MQPTTVLLIRSDHPIWATLVLALRSRTDIRIVGDVTDVDHVMPATACQPDAILAAADVAGVPVDILAQTLRDASPKSRIIVIGTEEALDGTILLKLDKLGVAAYLVYEGLRPQVVLRCIATVLVDDLLVASRPVFKALRDDLQRRQRPRVQGLVLTPRERVGMVDAYTESQRMVHATLWADDGDLAVALQHFCARAGIALETVATAEGLLDAVCVASRGDFVLVDCTRPVTALKRATAVGKATDLDVYIIHPDESFVGALRSRTHKPLLWLPPTSVGIVLLNTLRYHSKNSGPAILRRSGPLLHRP